MQKGAFQLLLYLKKSHSTQACYILLPNTRMYRLIDSDKLAICSTYLTPCNIHTAVCVSYNLWLMSSRRTVKQTGTLVPTIHVKRRVRSFTEFKAVGISVVFDSYWEVLFLQLFKDILICSWNMCCVGLVSSKMFKRKDSIKNNLSKIMARKIWRERSDEMF